VVYYEWKRKNRGQKWALEKGGLPMGDWGQVLHLFIVIVIAALGGLLLGGLALIGLVRLQIRGNEPCPIQVETE
jgi:hypothetical protein